MRFYKDVKWVQGRVLFTVNSTSNLKKEITVVDLKIAAELMWQDGKNMKSSFLPN